MKTPAAAICILIILFSLTSCKGAAGSVFKNLPAESEALPKISSRQAASAVPQAKQISAKKAVPGLKQQSG